MISAVVMYEDRRVSIHSSATKEVGKIFTKGFYRVITENNSMSITQEKLLEYHVPYDSIENQIVLKTVESFFTEGIEEKFKQLEYIHKLGVLLHGAPGTGKTSLLNFISKELLEYKDAIVFFCDNANSLASAINLARMIREIQNNTIVFIADEFERYAAEAESEMKGFLDGNNSISNMLFLAATNYIDKVPDTLKKRPSRFRVVVEIKGISDKNVIKGLIEDISNKIQPSLFTKEEIEGELKKITEVTLDDIKHICLDKLTNNYLPSIARESIGFNNRVEEEKKKESTGYVWGFLAPSSKISNKPSNI